MPGNEVHGAMGMQMGRRQAVAAEPAAAEPAAAEPAVDEQTLGNEEKRYLIAKYPEASDLLNLFATGGPGKRIFTEEELYFYNGAIKIYTQNTVSALDLLFPIKVSEYGVMRGERPTINIIGNVDSIPDIPFYNHRKQRGDNVEGIIEKLVNVIRMPPYGTILLKDLNEAAEILINGVKRKNGKREGILDDYHVFNLIKEKIKFEIPDDARRSEIIQKIDNAMGFALEMFAKLQEYASSREPWSTELHGFKWVGGKPNPRSIPDLPFDLGEKFQPPEPPSLVRPSPATPARAPAATARAAATAHPVTTSVTRVPDAGVNDPLKEASESAIAAIRFDTDGNSGDAIPLYYQAASLLESMMETIEEPQRTPIMDKIHQYRGRAQKLSEGVRGGGKRKRKHKRTRKTHKRSKHKLKRSKHKKSHKRKKTLKRKYKNKSKRRY